MVVFVSKVLLFVMDGYFFTPKLLHDVSCSNLPITVKMLFSVELGHYANLFPQNVEFFSYLISRFNFSLFFDGLLLGLRAQV